MNEEKNLGQVTCIAQRKKMYIHPLDTAPGPDVLVSIEVIVMQDGFDTTAIDIANYHRVFLQGSVIRRFNMDLPLKYCSPQRSVMGWMIIPGVN